MTGGDKPDIGQREEKIGRLAATSLRSQAPATHLDAESLAAFAEKALSPDERGRALAHLAECRECRDVVFLSQSQTGEEQRVLAQLRSRGALVFRWAGVTCAFAIVAAGAFFAKHEMWHQQALSARKESVPKMYTRTVKEHSGQVQSSVSTATGNLEAKTEIPSNGRPEPKHMTARPHAKMQFDSSDQVRIARATHPAANLQAKAQNADDLRSVGAATAPTNITVEANKVQTMTAPRGMTEIVHVTNENVTVDANAAAVVPETPAPAGEASKVASRGELSKITPVPTAQWSLSSSGALQRSLDQGKTWQEIAVNGERAGFLASYSSGSQVWVGGSAGALFRSTDSGVSWTRITPALGQRKLTADIVYIAFTDSQNGQLRGSGGEVWTTNDGGQTWKPQN